MKAKAVVEIRGGTFVGFYTDSADLDVHVVDWDDIAESSEPTPTRVDPSPLADMPEETCAILAKQDASNNV